MTQPFLALYFSRDTWYRTLGRLCVDRRRVEEGMTPRESLRIGSVLALWASTGPRAIYPTERLS